MSKKQEQIDTAIELAKKFPYKWVASPRIQMNMDGGDIGNIRVFANAKRFPTSEELIDLHKYIGLKIEKRLSNFGFPKIFAETKGVTLHIHCKGCPDGYEAIIEKFPHTRVKRTCQLIKTPQQNNTKTTH